MDVSYFIKRFYYLIHIQYYLPFYISVKEVKILMNIIRKLKEQEIGIIYILYHFAENYKSLDKKLTLILKLFFCDFEIFQQYRSMSAFCRLQTLQAAALPLIMKK